MKALLKKALCIGLSLVTMTAMSFSSAMAETSESRLATVAAGIVESIQNAVQIPEKNIAILYTSDINSEVSSNLELSGMVAYGNGLKEEGYVTNYVDCGNSISGNTLGYVSNGAYAIEAMNIAGINIAVPGEKEFGFGISKFITGLAPLADYKYISCNLRKKSNKERVFKPYVIKKYGDTSVAFIGITDPSALNEKATGYANEGGTQTYYLSGDTAADLCTEVQSAVDAAYSEGAQYIVALGNLSGLNGAVDAAAVIAGTTGINCFINGSAASSNSLSRVKDKSGNNVILTDPGEELESFGVLTISPSTNTISTKLVTSFNYRNTIVKDKIDELTASYSTEMKTAFATTSSKLAVSSNAGKRIAESQETNFGDLVADAYRYVTGADIAVAGASEIGANIPIGSISYQDISRAVSGGDAISVVKITGLNLMDMLEMSARIYPDNNPEFLQISGMTFDINETVIPSVTTDATGSFKAVNGDYRVTNIKINGETIDLLDTYTLAASEKMIKGLTGYKMLESAQIVKANAATDNLAIISYIRDGLGGTVGAAYAQPQGRLDSIKLARQSVINAEVEAKVNEKIKNYSEEIKELRTQLELQEKVIAVKSMTVKATSKFTKTSDKRKIKVSWTTSDDISGVKYQVYRSTKKTSGFKKMKSTSNKYYSNTADLKKGSTYYYKVRAYIYTGGKYYYSNWSSTISRKVTK